MVGGWQGFGVIYGKKKRGITAENGSRAVKLALDGIRGFSVYQKCDFTGGFFWRGELTPSGEKQMIAEVGAETKKIVDEGSKPLAVGGDHSITYATLNALAKKYGPLTVIDFDAHFDLMDVDLTIKEERGAEDKFTHATFMRRALEDGLVKRLVYVGVRDSDIGEMDFAEKSGAIIFTPSDIKKSLTRVARTIARIAAGPTYVTIDIDALDPSLAPSVYSPIPGGISISELLEIIRKIKGPVGMDIVEVCSPLVSNDITARAAAYIIREYLCFLAKR